MLSVWRDGVGQASDAMTPEQRIESLGTKAADLFVVAGKLAELIAYADPTAATRLMQVPANFTVTPNVDGTVTLTRQE